VEISRDGEMNIRRMYRQTDRAIKRQICGEEKRQTERWRES
jgi:hypothetical protein